MTDLTWIDPTRDRSKWPPGPWDGEPDKVQWKDAETGLTCLAKRNPHFGNWCGYVGVPSNHPWHGIEVEDAEVHGGITFNDFCQEGLPEQTICHVPEAGEPDHLYWIGFDCAHAWDLSPYFLVLQREYGSTFYSQDQSYKDLAYVKNECARLARQIAEAHD